MTAPGSERQARKEFVRDRQRMVITVAICFLVACVVIATLVLLGVFKTEKEKAVETAETNFGVVAPCVATDSKAAAYTSITLRVMNGTDKSGIGQALGKALTYRGFIVQGVSDFDKNNVKRTEIRFGKNGITQAYTLYSQFNDALLRMDDRSDKWVDVVIGSSFQNLNDADEVTPAVGGKLKSVGDCKAAADITNLPKAGQHTAVN